MQRRHTLKAPALKVQILSVPVLILEKTFLCLCVSFVSSKIVMCFTRQLQSIFLHICKTWMLSCCINRKFKYICQLMQKIPCIKLSNSKQILLCSYFEKSVMFLNNRYYC